MKKKENILKQYEIHADKIYNTTLDTLDIVQEIEILQDKLNNTFTEEQKKLFEELKDKENKKNEELYKNMFIEGFSLSTKLLVEGMQD